MLSRNLLTFIDFWNQRSGRMLILSVLGKSPQLPFPSLEAQAVSLVIDYEKLAYTIALPLPDFGSRTQTTKRRKD